MTSDDLTTIRRALLGRRETVHADPDLAPDERGERLDAITHALASLAVLERRPLIDGWKVTRARAYPDPVTFDSGQRARAFQTAHGGDLWHRRATAWERCDP